MQILYIIIAVLIVFLVVAFLLPNHRTVQRSIVINAPAAVIMELFCDFHTWQLWGSWDLKEPDIERTYHGTPGAIGHNRTFVSKEGNGYQTITSIAPDRRVEMDLGFEGMGVSQTAFECAPEGAAQRVTWTMAFEAGNNPMKRYFGLFFDRVIGPDYEKGLANMKALLEQK